MDPGSDRPHHSSHSHHTSHTSHSHHTSKRGCRSKKCSRYLQRTQAREALTLSHVSKVTGQWFNSTNCWRDRSLWKFSKTICISEVWSTTTQTAESCPARAQLFTMTWQPLVTCPVTCPPVTRWEWARVTRVSDMMTVTEQFYIHPSPPWWSLKIASPRTIGSLRWNVKRRIFITSQFPESRKHSHRNISVNCARTGS